jgi:hypothetical protein
MGDRISGVLEKNPNTTVPLAQPSQDPTAIEIHKLILGMEHEDVLTIGETQSTEIISTMNTTCTAHHISLI